MSNYGPNTKKYAEAMKLRDWQTCELICAEHEGLLQEIVKRDRLIDGYDSVQEKLMEQIKELEKRLKDAGLSKEKQ
jgi:hypothetical protein